jgi:hypothetical protein
VEKRTRLGIGATEKELYVCEKILNADIPENIPNATEFQSR